MKPRLNSLATLVALALTLHFCVPPLACSQTNRASAVTPSFPPVETLLGKWKNENDGSVITIEPLYFRDPARKNDLKLSGSHDWGGTYRAGSLGFRRSPKIEEMNSEIPDWARKRVDGKLSWELELIASDECGYPALKGKWYPGEVSWREEKDQAGNILKQEAAVVGRGVPREVEYTRLEITGNADDEEFLAQPSIVIRSAVRPVPDRVLDSVHRNEPFHVEVRTSREDSAKLGAFVDVRFRVASSNKVSNLRLSSENSGVRLPVVYSSPGPVTLRDGGEGAGKKTAGDFLRPRGPYDPLVMAPLDIVNNDLIEVALVQGESQAEFRAYVHPVQQAVGRVETSLKARRDLYESILLDPQIPVADREVARTKIRLVTNAQRIMKLLDRNRPQLPLFGDLPQGITFDHQEFMVGAEYLKLLDDPANWAAGLPLLPENRPGRDPRFPGILYYSPLEKPLVDRALKRGSQLFFGETEKVLRDLSSDLILFAISTTGADEFVILCFGVTPTGERVDTTQRVLAGISFASQRLLGGALAARRYQSFLKESEAAARRFETQLLLTSARSSPRGLPAFAGAGVGVTVSRRTQVIGAEVDLERVASPVNTDTTLPGARIFSNRRYLLQEFDDTCGPTVAEQFRRKWGLPPRTERESMLVSYGRGKAYRAGKGMSTLGLATFLHLEKAAVKLPRRVTLAQIELQLLRGRQVAVMVNTAPKGAKPFWHWVEPEEIIHKANGKNTVVFGDPWNGNVWEIDACLFWERMNRNEVVFAKWR